MKVKCQWSPRIEFTVHIEWLPDMKLKHSVLPVRCTLIPDGYYCSVIVS